MLGLKTDQIRVRGVEADWHLTFDDGPRRILVLLDVSGSMEEISRWKRARTFVRTFLGFLEPEDEIALHVFAERHQVVVPFTRQSEAITVALDSLPRPGSRQSKVRFGDDTALADALLAAAGTSLHFGDSILLVSDMIGQDSSDARPETIAVKLVDDGIRLFYFNIYRPGEPLYAPPFDNPALKLVEGTGGKYFSQWHSPVRATFNPIESPHYLYDDFPAVARKTYIAIKYIYRLELHLREPLKKKRKLRVEARDKRVKKQFKLEFFYPKVLYPQSSHRPPDRRRRVRSNR